MGERKRRFSDSSVSLHESWRLYDPDLTSSAEICLYDEPRVAELRETQAPRYRVFMTRLEPRVRVPSGDHALANTVAESKALYEKGVAEREAHVPVGEALLFDATGVGQVMCIGVGRYAHNLLRPFLGEDADAYYRSPEALDPACVCGQISRDHGLVFLDESGEIRYRDFGTKKEGRRAGSKNGTWLNGEEPVRDVVIKWAEGAYLGIGGRAWVKREGELAKEHVFKLRYERLGADG